MTSPLDVKRDLDEYQAHAGKMRRLVVPPHRYLMVDGHGDPNTAPRSRDALQTLYPFTYALEAVCREEPARAPRTGCPDRGGARSCPEHDEGPHLAVGPFGRVTVSRVSRVELGRFELPTSSMPWKRATNCAIAP